MRITFGPGIGIAVATILAGPSQNFDGAHFTSGTRRVAKDSRFSFEFLEPKARIAELGRALGEWQTLWKE